MLAGAEETDGFGSGSGVSAGVLSWTTGMGWVVGTVRRSTVGTEAGCMVARPTFDGEADVPIPEADYSFKTLKHAQAIGDLQALQSHGRPVVRLQLTGDPVAALRQLTGQLTDGLTA